MSVLLTPGQAGDDRQLLPLLDQIRVAYYRAEILIAATVLWLRGDRRDTP